MRPTLAAVDFRGFRFFRGSSWPSVNDPQKVRSFVRLLLIGDIVGRPGRQIVVRGLPGLIRLQKLDLVVANAENAAAVVAPWPLRR